MVLTGNSTVDSAIITAEVTRQGVVNVAGVSQSTASSASVAFYKTVLAAKLSVSPALDVGNEIAALENLYQAV